MSISKKIFILFYLFSIIYSQDEVFLKSGKRIIANVDTSSIRKESKNIRLKKRFESNYSFVNVTTINFIRSWNGILLYPIGVVVNNSSRRIHLPNVQHLPIESNRIEYKSKEEAEKNGFNVCTACFDNGPILSDLDLELELTKETILAIQNSNEIMYEHEKLPVLQKYVNKILSSWPERLKGYDYRIQIIRDNSPNAMAIAGGNLYFTTGLIEMTETDTEMEAIVAHEIAHVERRHSLRGYKEYLKKHALLAIAGLAMSAVASNSKSKNADETAAALTVAGAFALDFSQKGYERDLEQEADLFAQIYLAKLNEPVTPMLSSLDKLATHTASRIGYVPIANAYSSHPDLMSRMNQIKYGELFNYDEPVRFSLRSTKKNITLNDDFINMDVNYLYSGPSSKDPFKKEIIIAGTVYNNDLTYSFQINDLILNFIGTLGLTKLDGLVDVVVPRGGNIDFVGRVQCTADHAKIILESLKSKSIIPYQSTVTAVVIKPGQKMKRVNKMVNIKCAVVLEN